MILMLTSGAWNYSHQPEVDAYYQYFPLRLIFPALSVLIFVSWKEPLGSSANSALIGIFAGLAIAWNMDSGIPVFGAFLAFLIVETLLCSPLLRWLWARHLAVYACVSVGTLLTLFLYLEIKSGYRIDLKSSLKYQDLFYRLGYFMLPMPEKLSPWMIVVAYYIYGVVQYFGSRSQKQSRKKHQLVFFLSILGIGLFAYYQGRSHELNLLSTLWPAAMISMILFDWNVRAFTVGRFQVSLIYFSIPSFVFGAVSLLVMVHASAYVITRIEPHIKKLTANDITPVIQNIDFIKKTSQNMRDAAIISSNQAVYFAHTGLTSSFAGPGMVETVMVEDARQVIEKIIRGEVRNLYIQIDDSIPPFYQRGELYQHYSVESESKAGLLHLIPNLER